MKNRVFFAFGVFVALFFLSSAVTVAYAAPKYSFKLGHAVQETHPYHLGAMKFKEIVERETDGDVEIKLFPNNQLGSGERDLIEGMQLGTVDLVVSSTGPMGGFEKKFMLFDFPFLFRDKEHAYKVLDGPVGQYVMGLLEKKGIKGLAWYENGFRNFTNSKKAVETPEDVEGLKLRTMENKVHMAIWRALGADPTPMAWGELFTALQQGVVDGQENPVPIIYTSKLYEVQKYLAMTGHVFSPSMILIGKRQFDGMPEDYRRIFLDAAQESAVYERSEITRMENEQVDKLKELGMVVTYPDKAAFLEKTKPVYDQYRGELGKDGDLLDRIIETK
ncbi:MULTISPECIES: TRAP transporter substrate-binding protein [Dethiosulfovibrio]|uniref:TRAP transporter substrate-binding protein n=2 Tax=Dethiosulfovibrio TaxID=47054 RepID=A0ABS9EM07_9BACT|nr:MULTISPECIES: TRAP transporter substrate-binding protein [Dethiosulfovibrio]MCF4113172.1 TRAP transporter substrate-binding protein [Dethiosulfovibrio russensis]MCF4142236.1 TRAP transporter substrate-binding protein [Dethiosulfovibrio marinus]MCF4144544.1 TRAP transporter substrate-binding protein [Dethiosulfovibrio acidaminovorans]